MAPRQVHIPKMESAPLPQAAATPAFAALAAMRAAEVHALERKAVAEKERSAAAAELAIQEEKRAQAAACARQEEEKRAQAAACARQEEERRAEAAVRARLEEERRAEAAERAASASSLSATTLGTSTSYHLASSSSACPVPSVFRGHASYARHAQTWVEAFEDGPTWGQGGAEEMLPMARVAHLSKERNVSMRTGGMKGPIAKVRLHAVTDDAWDVVTRAVNPFVAALQSGAECSDVSHPIAWINNWLVSRALDVQSNDQRQRERSMLLQPAIDNEESVACNG